MQGGYGREKAAMAAGHGRRPRYSQRERDQKISGEHCPYQSNFSWQEECGNIQKWKNIAYTNKLYFNFVAVVLA